jgi:hypothetical protein
MASPNTLFAVFAVSEPVALEPRIQAIAPWLYLKVAEGQWLLIAPSTTTTKEVSEKIGISIPEPVSIGIVVRIEGYFGRGPASTWEWISTKLGADLGAAAPVKA